MTQFIDFSSDELKSFKYDTLREYETASMQNSRIELLSPKLDPELHTAHVYEHDKPS